MLLNDASNKVTLFIFTDQKSMEFLESEKVPREFDEADDGTASTPEGWRHRGSLPAPVRSWGAGFGGRPPGEEPQRRGRLVQICDPEAEASTAKDNVQQPGQARQARSDVKDQEIQMLEAQTKELPQRVEPVKQDSCTPAPSAEHQTSIIKLRSQQ